MRKCVTSVLALGVISVSCTAPSPKQNVQQPDLGEIRGLVIENITPTDVTDVRLSVAGTPRQVNVNRVLPHSEFATEFPAKQYRGNPARLTWRQNGTLHQSQSVVFSLPSSMSQDNAVTAYLTIGPNYKVSARAE